MLKVIDIMSHPPSYEAYQGKEKPPINWNLPNGSWVGIWGYEWSDQMANEILKVDDSITYEIWQPDLRADKVYQHRFENGSVHKLFPAVKKNYFEGLKPVKALYSDTIVDELNKISGTEKAVVVIDGAPTYFNINLYNLFSDRIPVVNFFSGDPIIFFSFKDGNILRKIHYHLLLKQREKYFSKIKNIMFADIPETHKFLSSKFNMKIYTTIMGIDFDFWKIDKTKNEARKLLNIPEEPFVIFSSSRLNQLKRVDVLIKILGKLNSYNFRCYISGTGIVSYYEYLVNLIEENKLKDKVFLVGFINDDELKNYYLASDLFVTLSYAEGGPVSAWKAMALEIPVLTTDTGNVVTALRKFNAGEIVDVSDYNSWTEKFHEILNGKKIQVIPRKEVELLASWENVAKRFLNIYKEVYEKFYGGNNL